MMSIDPCKLQLGGTAGDRDDVVGLALVQSGDRGTKAARVQHRLACTVTMGVAEIDGVVIGVAVGVR